jgi:hypothetical protein
MRLTKFLGCRWVVLITFGRYKEDPTICAANKYSNGSPMTVHNLGIGPNLNWRFSSTAKERRNIGGARHSRSPVTSTLLRRKLFIYFFFLSDSFSDSLPRQRDQKKRRKCGCYIVPWTCHPLGDIECFRAFSPVAASLAGRKEWKKELNSVTKQNCQSDHAHWELFRQRNKDGIPVDWTYSVAWCPNRSVFFLVCHLKFCRLRDCVSLTAATLIEQLARLVNTWFILVIVLGACVTNSDSKIDTRGPHKCCTVPPVIFSLSNPLLCSRLTTRGRQLGNAATVAAFTKYY